MEVLVAECTECGKRHKVVAPARRDDVLVRCCGYASPIWRTARGVLKFDGYIKPVC